MFFLQLTFPRNGRPGWPIYNDKYTYLSFSCTTKRNIVASAKATNLVDGIFDTKNWVWNVDPWHGQQVDPQRLIMEKTKKKWKKAS